jgi:hypothetical protein
MLDDDYARGFPNVFKVNMDAWKEINIYVERFVERTILIEKYWRKY